MSIPTDNGKAYFVKDFYKRTIHILNSTQSEYDVALLINSMVGLLVVPKERYFHSIQVADKFIDTELLNCIRAAFDDGAEISFTEILRRLRNSVCHGNMEIRAENRIIMGISLKFAQLCLFRKMVPLPKYRSIY